MQHSSRVISRFEDSPSCIFRVLTSCHPSRFRGLHASRCLRGKNALRRRFIRDVDREFAIVYSDPTKLPIGKLPEISDEANAKVNEENLSFSFSRDETSLIAEVKI